MKKIHLCELLSKTEISKDTFDFTVKFPEIAQPGQFVHILCGDRVFLRRPISICDDGDGYMRFIFYVKGEGTRLLAEKKVGDVIDILGPLGNGFNTNKCDDKTAILVGGGIGIFPLVKLAKALKQNVEVINGFRTKNAVILEDEFNQICSKVYITTDDGSYGTHGFVTDVLADRIKAGDVSAIYTCGPISMMAAVKKITAENNIYCEASMEQRMGCGIGACAVCTCKANGKNVKVCDEGPVFDAKDLDI